MMEELKFESQNNEVLYGHKWEVKTPSKIVVIITGMAEHSARYDDFAKFLNSNNISVYCLNHFGQGEKNGELMNPTDDFFFKYIEILKDFNKLLKYRYDNNIELINFAHSMGSFVLQGYIEKYSTTIDKAIICGSNGPNPLVKIGYFLAKLFINKKNLDKKSKFFHSLAIGSYEKSVKNRKSSNDWISYNEDNVKKYDEDPLCGAIPTNRFYKYFLKGLSSIQKSQNIDNISEDLDILIIGGKDDPVGNFSKGLIKLEKLYTSHNLKSKLIIYPNMRHEILNEDNNSFVYNDILDFIMK